MNQILTVAKSTSKKNKKTKAPRSNGPVAIEPIVRFFAIFIIIFGIACISGGTYNFITINEMKTASMVKPELSTELKNNRVVLNITHERGINKVLYNWNGGEDTVLYGRGQTAMEEELILPIGHNTLNLTVIDSAGAQTQYQEDFELSDEDVAEPVITVVQDGNATVKITAKDDTALNYMEYYWEGEEPTKILASQDEQKIIEEKIEVREGENKLIIVAEDTNHNIKRTEKVIVGATKPKISLDRQGDTIIITAVDEQGVSKVEYTLNGTEYKVEGNGEKQLEVKQNLVNGTNEFIITVTNINNLISQGKASCEK